MLSIHNLHAAYGEAQVLNGVSMQVQPGEIVAILGRNGMGKTSLVRSIMNLSFPRKTSGTVSLSGTDFSGLAQAFIRILDRDGAFKRVGVQGTQCLVDRTGLSGISAFGRTQIAPGKSTVRRGAANARDCQGLNDGPENFVDGRADRRPCSGYG